MKFATVAPQPSNFVGVGFGEQPIARSGGELHFTVVANTPYPADKRDMCARENSTRPFFVGSFFDAAAIYQGTVGEDGYFQGLLDNMADGLLACPHPFQGDPRLVSALSNADGTPGDDPIMHPIEECRQILKDLQGFYLGVGQYTLSCWRCRASDVTNFARSKLTNSIGGEYTIEVCRACDAARVDRPSDVREIFVLHHWDLKDLWQQPYSKEWHIIHRGGTTRITPGDGEWALFQMGPMNAGWRYGPYLWLSLAAIFARDSRLDRQQTSYLSTPTHLWSPNGDSHPETRADIEKRVRQAGFQRQIVLEGKWTFDIKEPANRYHDVASGIIDDMIGMAEVGLTGTRMGLSKDSAFTDVAPFFRIPATRRKTIGEIWSRQVRQFGHVWWALDNFGTRNAPWHHYDTRSPQDKLAEASALVQMGAAMSGLVKGFGEVGLKPTMQWMKEFAQGNGITVEETAKRPPDQLLDTAPIMPSQRPKRRGRK